MAKPKGKKGDPKFSKLDQRIYDNVVPHGYSNKPGNVAVAVRGVIGNKKDREKADVYREELWKYALGSPDPLQHFDESAYAPSKSTDANAK